MRLKTFVSTLWMFSFGIQSIAAHFTVISKSILDTNGGEFIQVKIGQDNLPIIPYRNEECNCLRISHCDDILCDNITSTTFTRNDKTIKTSATYIEIQIQINSLANHSFPYILYSDQLLIFSNDTNSAPQPALNLIKCFDNLCDKRQGPYSIAGDWVADEYIFNQPTYSSLNWRNISENGRYWYMSPIILIEMKNVGLQYEYLFQDITFEIEPIYNQHGYHNNGKYSSKLFLFENKFPVMIYHDRNDDILHHYNPAYGSLDYHICGNIYCNETMFSGIIDSQNGHIIGECITGVSITGSNNSETQTFGVVYCDTDVTNGNKTWIKYANCNLAKSENNKSLSLDCVTMIVDYIGEMNGNLSDYSLDLQRLPIQFGMGVYQGNAVISYFTFDYNETNISDGVNLNGYGNGITQMNLKIAECDGTDCSSNFIKKQIIREHSNVNGTLFGIQSSIAASDESNVMYLVVLDYNSHHESFGAQLMVVENS